MRIFAWGPSPNFGEGVELGGSVWYPVKLFHIRYNLFAGIVMLSLSVYEPIAIQILQGGEAFPNFREGVELGGWVSYPVKVRHIR